MPCSRAAAAASLAIRVLPMPASPVTRTADERPPASPATASRSRPSSAVRPTVTGLTAPSILDPPRRDKDKGAAGHGYFTAQAFGGRGRERGRTARAAPRPCGGPPAVRG